MPKQQAEKKHPNAGAAAPELTLEDRVELMTRAIDAGILRRAKLDPAPLPSSFRDLKTV